MAIFLNTLTPLTVFAAVLLLILAYIVIWSRRGVGIRSVGLLLSVLLIGVHWFAFRDLLARPEPIAAEQFRTYDGCLTVVYAMFHEPHGIYMLVQLSPNAEPRYIFVTWDLKFALSLQKALQQSREYSDGKVAFGAACQKQGKSSIGGGSWDDGDGEFKFYRSPVQDLPPKDLPQSPSVSPIQIPDRD